MAKKPATKIAAAAVTAPVPEPILGNDYVEHERTYHGFMALTKWSVIGLAIFMVILFFLVSPMIRGA